MGTHMKEGRSEQALNRLLVGAVITLVVLSALGGILTVGDHLSAANPVLGGIFYAAIAAVVAIGIAYPLLEISKRPVFGLYMLEQGTQRQRDRRCAMLADNLEATGSLDEAQRDRLQAALAARDCATVADMFRAVCTPLVNDQIKQAAKRSFLASVIARGALVEALTTASISLDLVRSIVEACGFRPTKAGLARLYTRVMASALIAGGVEDMDLEQVFSEALGSGAGAKGAGLVLGGATDGLVSAYLVFRIGTITRDYLFAEKEPVREQVRRASFGEAMELMKTSGFMGEVAQWAKSGVTDVARSATASAAAAARSAADGAANIARTAALETAGAAKAVAHGASGAARSVASGLVGAAQSATSKAVDAARATVSGAAHLAHSAGEEISNTARRISRK